MEEPEEPEFEDVAVPMLVVVIVVTTVLELVVPDDWVEDEEVPAVDADPIFKTHILEAVLPLLSSTSIKIGKYPFLSPVVPAIIYAA